MACRSLVERCQALENEKKPPVSCENFSTIFVRCRMRSGNRYTSVFKKSGDSSGQNL